MLRWALRIFGSWARRAQARRALVLVLVASLGVDGRIVVFSNELIQYLYGSCNRPENVTRGKRV